MGWFLIIVIIVGTPIFVVYKIVQFIHKQAAISRNKEYLNKRMTEIEEQKQQREDEWKKERARIQEYYSVPRPPGIYCLGRREQIFEDVPVVGTSELKDKSPLAALKVPDHVRFMHDDINEQYDNAIKVYTKIFERLGYLYRENQANDIVFDWLEKDYPIYAQVSAIDGENIKVTLAVYTPLSQIYNKSKSFKLKGSKNEEMQQNLSCCSEDDMVEFIYDDDKERYLAYCNGGDIGYLPESYNMLLDDFDDYEAYIGEVDIDYGMYFANITIFYDDPQQITTQLSAMKCTSCGANNKIHSDKPAVCEYCGAPLLIKLE